MSFAGDLGRFNTKITAKVEKEVRVIALNVHKSLILKTPIDTGRAKANWNLSPGKIDTTVTMSVIIKPYSLKKGDGLKPIYTTNSLNYIIFLEHGHSKQAPKGMVQLTMNEFKSAFLQSIDTFK